MKNLHTIKMSNKGANRFDISTHAEYVAAAWKAEQMSMQYPEQWLEVWYCGECVDTWEAGKVM